MSAQATLEGVRVDHVQRRDLDEDSTPRGVVGAVLRASIGTHWEHGVYVGDVEGDGCGRDLEHWRKADESRVRALDIGAGFGGWSSELAHHWVDALEMPRELLHITGVEVNEDRAESLARWCDEVVIGDWRPALWDAASPLHWSKDPWDIIIGNPPFAHVLRQGRHPEPGKRTPYKPVDETMVPTLLRHAPAVLLLHTSGAFDDSAHGREVWRKYQPAAEWPLGRLGFRGDGKTDNRCYTASLWLRNHSGPTSKLAIDEIAPADRRWSGVIPGSESPDVARALGLPMVVGSEHG